MYPGVVVVFGMAIFWKRATNKAALWTAILTIPVGIVCKLMYPEMGFLLRMGYVFMVLALVAVSISLLDRKNAVASPVGSAVNQQKLLKASYMLTLGSAVCIVLGLIYSERYVNLAFSSIYMMSALFAFFAIIFYTNAKSRIKDPKAYDFEPALFKMKGGLMVGAMGIVAILIVIYAYFW